MYQVLLLTVMVFKEICSKGECVCDFGYVRENGVCIERPPELPGCEIFPPPSANETSILEGGFDNEFMTENNYTPSTADRKWQTPKKVENPDTSLQSLLRCSGNYKKSYQDMSNLQGYSLIDYDNPSMTDATLNIVIFTKNDIPQDKVKIVFNGQEILFTDNKR